MRQTTLSEISTSYGPRAAKSFVEKCQLNWKSKMFCRFIFVYIKKRSYNDQIIWNIDLNDHLE